MQFEKNKSHVHEEIVMTLQLHFLFVLNNAQTLFDFPREENEKQTWKGCGFANPK